MGANWVCCCELEFDEKHELERHQKDCGSAQYALEHERLKVENANLKLQLNAIKEEWDKNCEHWCIHGETGPCDMVELINKISREGAEGRGTKSEKSEEEEDTGCIRCGWVMQDELDDGFLTASTCYHFDKDNNAICGRCWKPEDAAKRDAESGDGK